MNDQPRPSIGERSTIVRCCRWTFSWRGLRRILIVGIWVVTILALAYGIENWRGRHAWNKHRRELEARGEQLDFKAFLPKPIPDEQNFAAIPLIQSWFVHGVNRPRDNYERVRSRVSRAKRRSEPATRQFVDLVAWQMAFEALKAGNLPVHEKYTSQKFDRESRAMAAPAVLDGLKEIESEVEQLRAASSRSSARYPTVYKLDDPWSTRVPHLARLKAVCSRLELRACAELAAGRTDEALADIELILHLADTLKDEPILISFLVRRACIELAMQPVWEGLAEQRWSDVQLQRLQSRLQRYDFVSDLSRPLAAEHAAGILTADLIKKKGLRYLIALGDYDSAAPSVTPLAPVMDHLIPTGWYYREKLNYSRLAYQQRLALAPETQGRGQRISPRRIEATTRSIEQALSGSGVPRIFRHHVLASLLLPALEPTGRRAVSAQTLTDQALVACALERHRLAKGEFPPTLDALVPQFLAGIPRDVLTGEPYRYRRTDGGRFVLYSVGWNEIDEGGVSGKSLHDEKEGDWVWQPG